MNGYIIKAENISKTYVGVTALKDVSMAIPQGKICCLVGENGCGKSTFVSCVTGVVPIDNGRITINNKVFDRSKGDILTTKDSINEGIQVIYQNLSLFEPLSVAENIAISRMVVENRKIVNFKEMHKIAQEVLGSLGISTLDLNMPVREISTANKQLVAIARAMSNNAKLIFMDEPTTALTQKEVDSLLSLVLSLKNKGIATVFISHKLDEVFAIADSITVFRNGEKVGDFSNKELDVKSISYYMTGREVSYPRYLKNETSGSKLLKVKGLSKKGNYDNISFEINRGDILGIGGLLGSGRTELALSLFGLNKPDKGEIIFKGSKINIKNPSDAKKAGIALLPESRATQGLFMEQSIADNASASILENLSISKLFTNKKKVRETGSDSLKKYRVKAPTIDTSVKSLSGGNQQKVVIAKWANINPDLYIMDSPTVGVDIGSKEEIYQQIQSFASSGMGIILISDEIEEILTNCNKVITMRDGKVTGYFDESDLSKKDIEKRLSALISNKVESGVETVNSKVGGEGEEA